VRETGDEAIIREGRDGRWRFENLWRPDGGQTPGAKGRLDFVALERAKETWG